MLGMIEQLKLELTTVPPVGIHHTMHAAEFSMQLLQVMMAV